MTTINDVARKAGVSKMTVSRVVNNSGYVNINTKEKVNKAIEELEFRPNMNAKILATGYSKIIAYVMINLSDPFHSMVGKGVQECCFEHGYTAIMCDAYSELREQSYFDMFIDRRVDGVIFHHLAVRESQLNTLKSAKVAYVLMDNEYDILDSGAVNSDNYAGAMMAVDHLASKGHKRIACITGTMKRPEKDVEIPYEDTFQYAIWRQRTQGFIDAMKKNGLSGDLIFQGNGLESAARECIPAALEKMLNVKEPPTAVYCENDIMAVMLLNELKKRGLRTPDDIAVVGHDGLYLCRLFHPHITTVAQPQYEMGYESANMLIRQIEQKQKPKRIVLGPKLIIGETT